ncbi:hypothetical protein [Methylibium petroleiphilum]|uniref:Transmembrane protein n=1 Tax=Methylibium petroleiphilum (strain ATCC BAA-1232 / LMG 22953 / PM1) TaxID=420662 RepID=A2SN86_METPP|nr:hypothetical protein [Methylibium petroleiphilum]ABM97025.1 hypothetical protein Mpe_B0250 [Methylibium petroleiphilum PM1]
MSREEAIEHEYTESRLTLAVMIVVLTVVALLGSLFEGSADAVAFEVLLMGSLLVLLGVAAAAPALRAHFGWRAGQ